MSWDSPNVDQKSRKFILLTNDFWIYKNLYQPLYKVCQDYLIACVENNLHSKISFPKDPWKIHTYLTSIGDKYINLQRKRVAFEVDGLKLPIQKSQVDSIQSVFYNGWTTGHYISNIFVFAPDGTVVSMVINAPGCLHDSTVSELGQIYHKLKIFMKIIM